MNSHGQRLAKRDKSVTRAELHALGWSDTEILFQILKSLGWEEDLDTTPVTASNRDILYRALQSWSLEKLPREPVIFRPPTRG